MPSRVRISVTVGKTDVARGGCGFYRTPRFAGVLGVAAGYVSQLSVRDGVLDVPLVGFYATTPFTRPTSALNKANNYLAL